MTLARTFVLREPQHYASCLAFLGANWKDASMGGHPLVVKAREMDDTRTLEQNDHFHALCSDIAKAGIAWAGKKRNAQQWKVLLVSGHAVATKGEVDIVPGLEGEFVNIRESTALMSIKRGASLIEYTLCFCAQNGVKINGPEA